MFKISPKIRRHELVENNQIPSLDEAKYYMGTLSQLVFDHRHKNIRRLFSTTVPSSSPLPELWESSDRDQLVANIHSKRQFRNKYIKTTIHEGILRIASNAQRKYEAEVDRKVRDDFQKDVIDDMRMMFEAEKRHTINVCVNDMKHECERNIELLTVEHEHKLKNTVKEIIKISKKKIHRAVTLERNTTTLEILNSLKDEIGYMVIHIYNEYEKILQASSENMIADFNQIMRSEREKFKSKMKAFKRQKEMELSLLQLKLENNHLSELMNVMYNERLQFIGEKSSLTLHYQQQILSLHKLLFKAKDIIDCLLNEEHKLSITNIILQTRIKDIIEEFQKFINFSFNTPPGQTDFLLSLSPFLSVKLDKSDLQNEYNDLSGSETTDASDSQET